MRRLVVTIAAATACLAGVPIMGASVGAAPIVAPGAIRAAADDLNVVETVQFIWLGHDYCWFDDGWNGPGWYWCDYGGRVGVGWGGGYGWHNWRGGHPGGDHGGGNQGGKAGKAGKTDNRVGPRGPSVIVGPSGPSGIVGPGGQSGKGNPSGQSGRGGQSGQSGQSGKGGPSGGGGSGKDDKQH
jgi:hypothetical protein